MGVAHYSKTRLRRKMELATLEFCIVLLFVSVEARPSGARPGACNSMVPGHGGSSQPIPGGYFLYSDLIDNGGNYDADTDYTGKESAFVLCIILIDTVRLEHQDGSTFIGFMIQSREPGTTARIGSFTDLPSNAKHLTCSGSTETSVGYY